MLISNRGQVTISGHSYPIIGFDLNFGQYEYVDLGSHLEPIRGLRDNDEMSLLLPCKVALKISPFLEMRNQAHCLCR